MANSPNPRSNIAHLMRRAGFGATGNVLDQAVAAGYTSTVESLLDFSQSDPADALAPPAMQWYPAGLIGGRGAASAQTVANRNQFLESQLKTLPSLISWWMARMQKSSHPLREKLSLIWHGNFATAISKVRLPLLMYNQNQLFRTQGSGNFEQLTQAVAKDPAMMIWLDTITNKAQNPNENFARELMERFTMGVGNYSEEDVRQGARAFTGSTISPSTGQYVFNPLQFDSGSKTYLGQTGNFTGEDIVHIATNTDASHRWVTSQLWSFLAYPIATDDPLVTGTLVPSYASNLDIKSLLRTIFNHPQFVSSQALNGLVKQPVEYVVGALSALNISLPLSGHLLSGLELLGQVPFDPPNVGGWPQNQYWLSTATSLARWQFAQQIARSGDISTVENASASQRPETVAELLGIVDDWSPSTLSALKEVSASPIDTVTTALVSPEYVSN